MYSESSVRTDGDGFTLQSLAPSCLLYLCVALSEIWTSKKKKEKKKRFLGMFCHVYSAFKPPRSGCDTTVTPFQDVSSA